MNHIVLITGATSGIGEAAARAFAAQGDRLILTGRRNYRLQELKTELENKFASKVVILSFDVRRKQEYVSRTVIPWMIERGQGHVVNIGSIAGREVYPRGGVYCATKHAVDAITQGMRMDLLTEGIRVSQVSPGAVKTEFSLVRFKGDSERAEKVYQGYQPLRAEDVAEVILFVAAQPPHVNINDVLVMPTAQANATLFDRK